MKIFDHIIVGDGPVSRILQSELAKNEFSCLVLDAHSGLQTLKQNMEIDSNVNFTAKNIAPSFHRSASEFKWAGGCQGWPKEDFSDGSGAKLPINPYSLQYVNAMKRVNKNLRIRNFNFLEDLPRIMPRKNFKKGDNYISRIYCKVLRDPELSKLNKKNRSNKYLSFRHNFILTSISVEDNYVIIFGIDPESGAVSSYKGKKLNLCLGAIENTRVLLASRENLGLDSNQFLGKYLSDHLALKFAKIHTSNLPRIIRIFSRPSSIDGHKIWPRLKTSAFLGQNFQNGFAHIDEFAFDNNLPFFFRLLRRIGKLNYYYSKKISGHFDLNIFVEKINNESNQIQIVKSDKMIKDILVSFKVDSIEIDAMFSIGNYWLKVIQDIFGSDVSKVTLYPQANSIEQMIHSGSHPSGTYRMSSTPNEGVVNHKSELWVEPRIRVLGSGVFPNASATHPTYTAMVLASLGVLND